MILQIFWIQILLIINIFGTKNHGVSEGRRIIVENCNTDYLMLLDDDIYVEDINLICRKIINSFDSDKFLGAIAFNIIDFNTKRIIDMKYHIRIKK